MNISTMSTADLIGAILGFVFTLMIFSYIFGDNPLFRVAIHIFIGVAAGYASVVAFYNVIWPQLIFPLIGGDRSQLLFLLVPLLLSGLILLKVSPRLAGWGDVSMAYLVGVGMATAIGGALLGTLFPQAGSTIDLFGSQATVGGANGLIRLGEAVIILVGVLSTLIYFHFGARARPNQLPRRSPLVEGIAWVGQIFISITLGALFAGVFSAALVALIERLNFIVSFLLPLFPS